ncbi:MAG: hypothetical protein DWC08_06925 [Candidatus Poseidoniales archaeon]|nr:MAG: hypothetical protein DWC08_06925 [Candidatus Poseidoniales archaeon]|tara:strand:- start:325 stop:822 length:498 start_codon:yes stop_codon:yes gene_type:complete
MSSTNPEIAEEKVKVTCLSCNKNIAVPVNFSGTVRCPHCSNELRVVSSIKGANIAVDEENLLIIDMVTDRRFWIGLAVPAMAPIITMVLLMLGIHQPGSPDIMGVIWFSCSLCLWPVIGLSISVSSGTFVKSFRTGARVSAIVALVIAFSAWALVFMWISGGVTN